MGKKSHQQSILQEASTDKQRNSDTIGKTFLPFTREKSNRRHQRTGGSQKPPEGHYTDLVVDIIDPTPMTFTGICKEGESNIDGIEEQEEQHDSAPNAPSSETEITIVATEEPTQCKE